MEDDFRRLVSATLRRLGAHHKQASLAYVAGCEERTIGNAARAANSLSGKALFNLLLADPTALDELAAHFGMRLVALDAEAANAAGQMMAQAAGFTATVATAMADGQIDHRERAEIVAAARPLLQQVGAMVAQHDRDNAADAGRRGLAVA
jgi:hypothetical protein